MGQSNFQPGRGFSNWPKDVLVLANAIGLEKFSVLGNSGGCGYAAACAASILERLRAVVIVSGAWRMDLPETMRNLPPHLRLLWNLARKAPFFLSPMLRMMRYAFKAGREQVMAQQKKGLPPSEYAVMEQPARLITYPEDGHLSTFTNHIGEIAEALTRN